jgi:hypothetical protein
MASHEDFVTLTDRLRSIRRWSHTRDGQRWLIAIVFIVLAGWYVGFAVERYNTSHFYGDEPEYYFNGVSIYEDGDLDLRNQFLDPDRRAFPGPLTFRADPNVDAPAPANFIPTTGVLFTGPANAVGGVLGVLLLYALMNVASLALMLLVLRRITGPNAALATVAMTGLSVPLAWHAASVWTEVPALLSVSAVLALLPKVREWWGAVATGLLLALLPWLHQKYIFVALGLAIAIILHSERRRWWPVIVGFPVLGFVGTALLSLGMRGRWNFTVSSASGDIAGTFDPRWSRNLAQPFAWLFDQTRGYLPYAPIWIIAGLGFVVLLRVLPGRRIVAFYAIAFLPFLIIYMAGPFLAGDAPPGRETLTALPVLMTLLAVGLTALRGPLVWTIASVAGVISMLIGTVPVYRYGMDIFFNNVGQPKLLNQWSSPRWDWAELWPRITTDSTMWSGTRLLVLVLLAVFAVATLYLSSRIVAQRRNQPFWSPRHPSDAGTPCVGRGAPG